MKSSVQSIAEPKSTVVFFGKTGVGKSSTLNALFGLNLATDPAKACTTAPVVNIDDQLLQGRNVQIVDLPGIGESLSADPHYQAFYEEWVPQADVLVWVIQADTRAYKRDEIFLKRLQPYFKQGLLLLVALNRVDHLAFGFEGSESTFDRAKMMPSAGQVLLLEEKISDVFDLFRGALESSVKFERVNVVPCAVLLGWGVDKLKKKIAEGCTADETL